MLSTRNVRKLLAMALGVTVPAQLVLALWLWEWKWFATGLIVGATAIVIDPEKKYAGRT